MGSSWAGFKVERFDTSSMQEFRVDRFGGTPFIGALYSVDTLVERRNRLHERVVARQLHLTLEANGIDHIIFWELETVPDDLFDEDARFPSSCGSKSHQRFNNWLYGVGPLVAPDCNLLLMNSTSGGCSPHRYRNVGTGPAAHITEDRGPVVRGNVNDEWAKNVSACLHEVGRQVGVGRVTMDGHPGTGWNDAEESVWHRTPNNNYNGSENACGEFIPDRQFTDQVDELWFHDCLFEHWELVPKPPLSGGLLDSDRARTAAALGVGVLAMLGMTAIETPGGGLRGTAVRNR